MSRVASLAWDCGLFKVERISGNNEVLAVVIVDYCLVCFVINDVRMNRERKFWRLLEIDKWYCSTFFYWIHILETNVYTKLYYATFNLLSIFNQSVCLLWFQLVAYCIEKCFKYKDCIIFNYIEKLNASCKFLQYNMVFIQKTNISFGLSLLVIPVEFFCFFPWNNNALSFMRAWVKAGYMEFICTPGYFHRSFGKS